MHESLTSCAVRCAADHTDENVESVQESENTIPEVSWKRFVVLIRRVQSPVPLGDSSLRVQLGPTLIWNVLPTVGSIPRGSWLL